MEVPMDQEEVVVDIQEDQKDQDTVAELSVQDSDSVNDGRRWYILQCYSNQELKVQARIEALIEERGWQDQIFQALVPQEETVEIKNNKRMEKTIKIFPGYVFVQMCLNDDVFYELRGISGVSKFIGSKTEPTPVTEDEVLKILRKIGEGSRKIDVDFEEGEIVKVIAGPFRGYSGPISEISAEKGHLKALISIFGRETPVQLDFDQVEKVAE